VYGPADGLHELAEVGHVMFFLLFSLFLALYYWIIFLYFSILAYY
jgi:hypothetical protein